MQVVAKFTITNQELSDLGQGGVMRFSASPEEYWDLLEEAEYRVDYFRHEIIASMSYESNLHSEIASRLNYLIQMVFWNDKGHRVHNSNRPVCIPACGHAVFNPDGCVVAEPFSLYEYRPGMNAELNPVLLFEVPSLSIRAYDLSDKLLCYKRIPSLRQIIYLEQHRTEVILYERTDDGRWLETTLSELCSGFEVQGKTISLRDIYGAG